MESIKNLKSKISKYVSNVFNKIKEIAKNINTPSYANFIYISYFYLIITATVIPISFFITNNSCDINDEIKRGIISLCERVAASGNTSILLSA